MPVSTDYPCPGCGFLVFSEPAGSFAICPVCGWEDDNVQATDPLYQGGANGISLRAHQAALLREVPLSIHEHLGFRREPTWRPCTVGE